MRKFLCLFLLLFGFGSGHAQMTSKIAPCFELTSIAFRLAGAPEYAQCGVPVYSKDIDAHFLEYAEHPLIPFLQQIRRDYGISYNAVSSTADWLTIKNGHVKLKPGYDTADVAKADPRWTEPVFRRYLKLLDDFYRKSRFRQFYDSHDELYRYAEGKLDSLLARVDTGWFERFYGQQFGDPDIFIGLCNGPSNYALTTESRNEGYGIVVGCGSDNEGMPYYNPLFLSIVLHEFAHNYSNPLFMEYWPQMERAAGIIYPYVSEQMAQIAYGDSKTTVGEWFNNLCVLMYYRETEPEWVDYLAGSMQEEGFVWMGRAVEFMDQFYADRQRYPHIGDFMPRLVEFLDETADNIDQVMKEYADQKPYIAEVTPAVGSTVMADALPSEVVVRFSEPMSMNGYGMNWIQRHGIEHIPIEGSLRWQDEYTLVIPLDTAALEPGKTYGANLLGWAFRSQKGFPVSGYYEVYFTVR